MLILFQHHVMMRWCLFSHGVNTGGAHQYFLAWNFHIFFIIHQQRTNIDIFIYPLIFFLQQINSLEHFFIRPFRNNLRIFWISLFWYLEAWKEPPISNSKMVEVANLLGKVIYLMAIIIRVVGLMARYFWFFFRTSQNFQLLYSVHLGP